MSDPVTTNYGWTLPTVGADSGAWGGLLNANWSSADTTVKAVSVVANAAVPAAGGTMSGALTNASGFIGPLTGNVTGNVSGSAGSCTGNATTATTATNATTAASCSGNAATATALVSGDQSIHGNLTVTGAINAIANDPHFQLKTSGSSYVLQMSAVGGINYDSSVNKINFVANGVTVASIDSSGNMILKGSLTQNGTP